jgi:murein DD-endopeptidase MepM/ murein hydrolase activator NlpD/SH3-like domain-containing protein
MVQQGTVTAYLLNVRNAPGVYGKVFTQLKKDALVQILEKANDDWVKIRLTDGREGYVAVAYLSVQQIESEPGKSEPSKADEPIYKVKIIALSLRVRSGPSTSYAIRGSVKNGDVIEVFRQVGDWYEIHFNDNLGYIHGAYTELYVEEVKTRPGFLIEQTEFLNTKLEPTKIIPRDSLEAGERSDIAAKIWNNYGGLLQKLADYLHIPVASMVAVIAAESSGEAFASDGRIKIRFEVHIFHHYWGQFNQGLFDRHFQFDSWREHQFRASIDEKFKDFHGNQKLEHDVLEFARALDNEAALLSTSMGMSQVMGFNYTRLGYESVQQMYDAFARSVQVQILGMFDFVKGTESSSAALIALQKGNYVSFANYYNGADNAETYGTIISEYAAIFDELIKTAEVPGDSGTNTTDDVIIEKPDSKPSDDVVIEPPQFALVAVPTVNLNFRDAPYGTVLGVLAKGTPVKILEAEDLAIKKFGQDQNANQWLYIENSQGQRGYAAAWLMIPSRLLTQANVSNYLDQIPQRTLPDGYYALWANQEKLGLPDPFDILPVDFKTQEDLTNLQINGFGPNTFAFYYWWNWYRYIGGMHNGTDYIVKTGTPILAVSDGVIIKNWLFMGDSREITTTLWCFMPENYRDAKGKRMMSNVLVAYGHLSDNNQRQHREVVKAGDVIAIGGTPAGSSDNDHLHMEVHLLQGDMNLPYGIHRSTPLLSLYKHPQPMDNNTPHNPLLFYSPRLINYHLHQGDTLGYANQQPDYPTVDMMRAKGIEHLPAPGQLTLAYYRYGISSVWQKPETRSWPDGVVTTDMLAERVKTIEAFEPYEATFL